jgi:predicted membrane protein
MSRFRLGKEVAAFFYIIPFLISTIGGSIIGYVLLKIMEKNKTLRRLN